jgi:hypothetical protein
MEAAVIKDRVKRKILRKLFDQLASSDIIKLEATPSKGGSVTFTCKIEVVKPRDNENETTKA